MENKYQDWREYKLEKEESELLESIEKGEWKSIGNIEERRQALRNFFSDESELRNNLTINLKKEDFESIRQKSHQYGMNYQDLIEKLIHNFAKGEIFL